MLFLTVAALSAQGGFTQDTYSQRESGGDIGYGVYRNGTIGKAKEDLETAQHALETIDKFLGK